MISMEEVPELGLIDKSDWAKFVSPHGNKDLPIYNWFSFKHGYSKELVDRLIDLFQLRGGDWVLDPFCGSGNTLLACKQRGINSIGIDILPFSVSLSNSKLKEYNISDLNGHMRVLANRLKVKESSLRVREVTLTDVPLIKKAFDPIVEIELDTIKQEILKIEDEQIRNLFMTGFLSIVEFVSNTRKSGGFLRIIKRDVHRGLAISLFLDKMNRMINDLKNVQSSKRLKITSEARLGDARNLRISRKFNAVITSPPYPNRHDYTRIYSLEMIVEQGLNNTQLKNIRYKTLRSHVEARKQYEANGYEKPRDLDRLIMNIRKNGVNNAQVVQMLYGYFEDMYLSLIEIRKSLVNGGKIAMVISNVRFAGVNLPIDEMIADIGRNLGLKPLSILMLRLRGNSSQQMRDYSRSPSRESIVIWEKHDN